MDTIRFYKVKDPHGNFSNFAPYRIFLEQVMWFTVEHYYQAQKFEDLILRDRIRVLQSPMKVAEEGRNRKNIIREDWEQIKEQVMLRAVKAKFLQHHALKKELLLTGHSQIVEHTSNDSYWGDGGNGTGKNRLGILLMEVRDYIKKLSDSIDEVLPPWIAFPEVSQFDMFWRMGFGEDYLSEWVRYFNNTDQSRYKSKFPTSEEWSGFYD